MAVEDRPATGGGGRPEVADAKGSGRAQVARTAALREVRGRHWETCQVEATRDGDAPAG